MLGEGMNLVAVSKLMGHDDVTTTMKYLHRIPATPQRRSTSGTAPKLFTC
jgi:site-specific recombinase XerD